MNEELTNDEVEIDLVDLGYVLLDKWRYLLISLIAGAVLLGAYSFSLSHLPMNPRPSFT